MPALGVFIRLFEKPEIRTVGIAFLLIFPAGVPVVQNTSDVLKGRSSRRKRGVMDWIIFGLVVTWLGIVSWFDIRKNEIPHSAWVVIPLIGAGLYRIWQGDWTLVLLAVLVAAVSERDRISQAFGWEELSRIITWLPLLFLGAFLSIQSSPLSALAIIGFWAAWELKWWGGADAVSAITVCLIWPGKFFIISFLVIHLIVVIVSGLVSMVREQKIKLHRLPGLPILLASVLILKVGLVILN
jgi:hypothetical protein